MVSAAEQLASNISLSTFSKATELKKRIWFALFALIVYRVGTYIPVPGIDSVALQQQFFQDQDGGIFGVLNLFTGGAFNRMAIFALNVFPYISASIIVQLLSALVPSFAELRKEGESGRKKLNQYTRYGTVLLATIQGYVYATQIAKDGMYLDNNGLYIATTVISLVAGTMFLVWLGDQITQRGIGNGVSLIIFAGIVSNLPGSFFSMLELAKAGDISTLSLMIVLVLVVSVVTFVVFMERAQRRVVIQYPKRQTAQAFAKSESSHLPLKLNTAGVIPPIFASSLLSVPSLLLTMAAKGDGFGWLQGAAVHLQHGQWVYMIVYFLLIVFFCFFYTAIIFNPEETADNLKRNGGFIPGIRPGKNTADYFDTVLTRLTCIGAIYLGFVCVLPEILINQYSIPLYFGGTSLLIVVSVTMDTVAQIHSHLLAHQYEGLLKKAKLKGRL